MENKMSKYILLCSLCVVFVAAQNNTTSTSIPTTTGATTVTVPNTSPTTLNDTTSKQTTSAAPTTPTSAPTTPTNNGTNSSTTAAPTTAPTTHTPISTTTMPSERTFSVSNGSVDCIILKLDAEFTIQYWNTKNVSQVAKFQLPQNSSARTIGNCNNQNIESITVMMYDDSVNLTMMFTKDGTNINLANSTVVYNTQNTALFTDAQAYTKSESGSIDGINAPLTGYYKCDSATSEKFGDNVTVTFSNMKVTAFNQNNNTEAFGGGTEKPCLADTKTDNIVPIAVGAALAGLVVIVLIAYLIGRRTNRQGYQSV